MGHNILPYLVTQVRSLSSEEHATIRENASLGLHDSEDFDREHAYPEIIRARVQRQSQLGESLSMTSLVGYAMGARRGRFGLPEEETMLWNEISIYAIHDFRQGHGHGSRAAVATSSLPAEELLDMTMEAFEDGLVPFGSSAGVLGHLAGVHLVDLGRRVV